jgi:hypothetical protein
MNSKMTSALLAAEVEHTGEKEYTDAAAQRNTLKDSVEKGSFHIFLCEPIEIRNWWRVSQKIMQ